MRRILLTRQDNSAVAEHFKGGDFEILELPLIECIHNVDESEASDVFGELGGYDWLVFSSPNAVRGFFKAFFREFNDIRALGIARIACIGDATVRELSKFYLRADVVPEVQTAAALAEAMGEYETLENLKILSVRGNLALPDLIKALEAQRAIVDVFEVYKTNLVALKSDDAVVVDFRKKGADAVVFASPSAVESFVRNLDAIVLEKDALRPKVVAIGSTTADAAKKKGMKVSAVSESPRPEDIAAAVKSLFD